MSLEERTKGESVFLSEIYPGNSSYLVNTHLISFALLFPVLPSHIGRRAGFMLGRQKIIAVLFESRSLSCCVVNVRVDQCENTLLSPVVPEMYCPGSWNHKPECEAHPLIILNLLTDCVIGQSQKPRTAHGGGLVWVQLESDLGQTLRARIDTSA